MLKSIRLLTSKFTEWVVVILLIIVTIYGMFEGQVWKFAVLTILNTYPNEFFTIVFGLIGGFVYFFFASLFVSLVLAILNIDRNIAALVGGQGVSGGNSNSSNYDIERARKAERRIAKSWEHSQKNFSAPILDRQGLFLIGFIVISSMLLYILN